MKDKTPTYLKAVAWIVHNDEPNELNLEIISGFISVCLVADLFGESTEKVAKDVLFFKRTIRKEI
jgi:hypothetical protein